MMLKRKILAPVLISILAPAGFAEFDHGVWDSLVQKHVHSSDGGVTTKIDYAAMKLAQAQLDAYLETLSDVSREVFEQWGDAHQLAFLINAYNAFTIQLVLSEYPDIDSIRDIGFFFRSPFRREYISLFGEEISLDDIEHGMIREWDRFQEPRIHFAVNCASISCPPLRPEAYRGDVLEQQLEDNTRKFLSNRRENYLEEDTLWVSSVFNWYGEDFRNGWLGIDSLEEFLQRYRAALGLSVEQAARLDGDWFTIRFTRYDWGLNDTPK